MSFAAIRRRRGSALASGGGGGAGSGWRSLLRPSPYAQPRFANGTAAIDAYGRGTVLDTTYNLAGQTGTVRTCTTTAQMTTAISAAVDRDIIVVAASFESPPAGWNLPSTGLTGTIYIVSDYEYNRQFGGGTAFQRRPSINDWSTLALNQIAPEVLACRARTTDTYRTLSSSISAFSHYSGDGPVFTANTSRTSRRWWISGIEIRTNAASALNSSGSPCYNLINIDRPNPTTDAECAGNIVIDRCWIHGGIAQSMRNAVVNNGSDVAMINCCLTDCHELTNGDAHCYAQGNTGLRSKLVNNTFHGASCVLIGGGAPTIATLPADVEYRFNYHVTPMGMLTTDATFSSGPYAAQSGWRSKVGGFESKYVRRMLIEGNYFHRARGSHYYALEMFSAAQYGTTLGREFAFCIVEDITIRGARVQDCMSGMYVASIGYDFPTDTAGRRFMLDEILMVGVGNVDGGGDRRALQIGLGADVTLSAITSDDAGSISGSSSAMSMIYYATAADGPRAFSGLRLAFGQYGIVGTGIAGDAAVTAQQATPAWTDVTLFGAAASGSGYNVARTTTIATSRAAVGFTDPASGNYQIAGSTTTMNQALNDALCGSFLNVEGF